MRGLLRSSVAACVIALTASGCGQKGPLKPAAVPASAASAPAGTK